MPSIEGELMQNSTIPQDDTTLDRFHLAETPCHRCGLIGPHRIESGSGPHGSKLVCRDCSAFLRWLPKSSPEEREAKRQAAIQKVMSERPVTPHQLQYLKKLAYKGVRPTNRLEASQKIDALRKARGWE